LIEEDKAILESLREFFGCGRVYFQKIRAQPLIAIASKYLMVRNSNGHHPIFIGPILLNFLQSARILNIFVIDGEKQRGDHLTSVGLGEIYSLKQQMH